MRLLLIRHAIAVPRGTADAPDADRPLTARGERRIRAAAKGLVRIADRPDAILTSPLARAFRTAEIAAAAWGRIEPRILPALAGSRPEPLLAALARYPGGASLALVGHEPFLSAILARMLGVREGAPWTFRKGGAALVDVEDLRHGGAALRWFVTPKVLRRLSR